VVQECAWSKDPQAEALGRTKVAKVVRDDEVGLARHGDLNDHLVVRILEEWPPEEEDCVFRSIRSPVPEGSDHRSDDPIRIRSGATSNGDGQVAGLVSGWCFKPFWRRTEVPRSVSM
jgi:hypothetical protein